MKCKKIVRGKNKITEYELHAKNELEEKLLTAIYNQIMICSGDQICQIGRKLSSSMKTKAVIFFLENS